MELRMRVTARKRQTRTIIKNEREGDDEKVITTKKQRLNYKEALSQDIPYTNHHYEENPQSKIEAGEKKKGEKEKSRVLS